MKLPGGVSVQFASDKPGEPEHPVTQFVLDALRNTAGAAITYHLDRENRVRSVEGVPEGGLQPYPENVKEVFHREIDLLPETVLPAWMTLRSFYQSMAALKGSFFGRAPRRGDDETISAPGHSVKTGISLPLAKMSAADDR